MVEWWVVGKFSLSELWIPNTGKQQFGERTKRRKWEGSDRIRSYQRRLKDGTWYREGNKTVWTLSLTPSSQFSEKETWLYRSKMSARVSREEWWQWTWLVVVASRGVIYRGSMAFYWGDSTRNRQQLNRSPYTGAHHIAGECLVRHHPGKGLIFLNLRLRTSGGWLTLGFSVLPACGDLGRDGCGIQLQTGRRLERDFWGIWAQASKDLCPVPCSGRPGPI